jgi:hypothetical protein
LAFFLGAAFSAVALSSAAGAAGAAGACCAKLAPITQKLKNKARTIDKHFFNQFHLLWVCNSSRSTFHLTKFNDNSFKNSVNKKINDFL